MDNKIKVTFDDSRSLEVYYKTKAIDVVNMVEGDTSDILALNINNELRSYDYELVKDSVIKFVKYNSPDGYRVYCYYKKRSIFYA